MENVQSAGQLIASHSTNPSNGRSDAPKILSKRKRAPSIKNSSKKKAKTLSRDSTGRFLATKVENLVDADRFETKAEATENSHFISSANFDDFDSADMKEEAAEDSTSTTSQYTNLYIRGSDGAKEAVTPSSKLRKRRRITSIKNSSKKKAKSMTRNNTGRFIATQCANCDENGNP